MCHPVQRLRNMWESLTIERVILGIFLVLVFFDFYSLCVYPWISTRNIWLNVFVLWMGGIAYDLNKEICCGPPVYSTNSTNSTSRNGVQNGGQSANEGGYLVVETRDSWEMV